MQCSQFAFVCMYIYIYIYMHALLRHGFCGLVPRLRVTWSGGDRRVKKIVRELKWSRSSPSVIVLESENGNKTSMTMTPQQHVSLRLETRTTLRSFLETLQITVWCIQDYVSIMSLPLYFVLCMSSCALVFLVSSPDQFFRARPADSSTRPQGAREKFGVWDETTVFLVYNQWSHEQWWI